MSDISDIRKMQTEILTKVTETHTKLEMVIPEIEQNKKDIKSLNRKAWAVGGLSASGLIAGVKAWITNL